MPLPAIEGYEFGPYRIDTGERLLHRGGELISLPPKVAGTLLALLQSGGRMVDKGDLLKAVWPDTFVEEGALTRNISLLRKTLGDTDPPIFIETIPKRGYRFIAPVRTVPVEPLHTPSESTPEPSNSTPKPPISTAKPSNSTAKWLVLSGVLLLATVAALAKFMGSNADGAAPAIAPAAMTLAVLPFRNVEKDASQDYFADGMTQALITRLANLRSLRVISLASDGGGQNEASTAAAILRNQSVDRVLTGAILRSGGRLRVDAQLKDPRTATIYWANSYERDFQDVLALESDLAEAIAGEIQVTFSAHERDRLRKRRPAKPEALDAYLRGLYFWNRRTEDGLKRGIQYFQQAIAADPTYAVAYSGLADSYSLLGSIGTDGMPPRQAMPLAKAAALKALELDPDLADGHISLANVKLSYDWDLPGAAKEFSRALELNPSSATARHWYSHYFMAAGDMNKATEQMREALRLEPLSPSINVGIGWCLYYSRRYDEAIEQLRSVAEMDPGLAMVHQTLGMAYQQKGMYEQALEEYNRAAAFSNNSPSSVASLASTYAAMGKKPEALKELALLQEMSRIRHVPSFYFATVHYALGDLPKTFEFGWKAIGERCDYLLYLRVEPRAGKLAGNPEFLRVMAALRR